MTSVLTEQPGAVCPGEKGPWITQFQPGDTFISFYVARNPRVPAAYPIRQVSWELKLRR